MILRKKTLLILETRMTGHRPSYLRRITHLAIADGRRVIIAMPASCFEHPVYKRLSEKFDNQQIEAIRCGELAREANPYPTNPIKMLHNEYLCTRFYKEALKKARNENVIDLILINMFDDAAVYSGLLKLNLDGIPWLGIVMRQNFHFNAMGAIGPPASFMTTLKRKLFIRLLRLIKPDSRILTIDKSLDRYIELNYPALHQSIDHIPDPVDKKSTLPSADLRKSFEIGEEIFLILVYGSLRKNKGISLLLDVMHDLPKNVHILMAGTQSSEIEKYLNNDRNMQLINDGRIHQINRYIDLSEDGGLFNAANMVWLGYRNYYAMSAVLVQAAQYNLPVVAARTGLIGWLTHEYKTGVVVDTDSANSISRGIMSIVNNEYQSETARYNALASDHSLEEFEISLMKTINKMQHSTDQSVVSGGVTHHIS